MKKDIPFDKFVEYVKLIENFDVNKNKESLIKILKKRECFFNHMEKITWEDWEECSKEEMEKIPVSYLYDWTHVCAEYDKQEKVGVLYSRYDVKPLTNEQYLEKYSPKQKKELSNYEKIKKTLRELNLINKDDTAEVMSNSVEEIMARERDMMNKNAVRDIIKSRDKYDVEKFIEKIKESEYLTTVIIQKYLKLGYPSAGRMIDNLEDLNLISSQDEKTRQRKILDKEKLLKLLKHK